MKIRRLFVFQLVIFSALAAGCSKQPSDNVSSMAAEQSEIDPDQISSLSAAEVHFEKYKNAESYTRRQFYKHRLKQSLKEYVSESPHDFKRLLVKAQILARVSGEEAEAVRVFKQAVAVAPAFADKYRAALAYYQTFPDDAAKQEVKKVTRIWLERLIMIASEQDVPKDKFEEIVELYRDTRRMLESRSESIDTQTELKMKILLSKEPYRDYYSQYQEKQKNQSLQQAGIPVVLK